MDGGLRGASLEQDPRWANKHKRLMKSMKFPSIYGTHVDPAKVQLGVLKPWIVERVVALLGMEDDVLIEFIFGLLEQEKLDPRDLQIQLTAFLEDKTVGFMTALWSLLISAQENGGIPKEMIERKKEELRRKQEEEAKLAEESRRLNERRKARQLVKDDQDRQREYSPERRHQERPHRRSRSPPPPSTSSRGYKEHPRQYTVRSDRPDDEQRSRYGGYVDEQQALAPRRAKSRWDDAA